MVRGQDGCGLRLQEDPKYAIFSKVLRMSALKMAIARKMAGIGLEASVLDLDPAKPAPAPASPASSAAPRSATSLRARASHGSINCDVCAYPIVGAGAVQMLAVSQLRPL